MKALNKIKFKQIRQAGDDPIKAEHQVRYILNTDRNLAVTSEGTIKILTPLGHVIVNSSGAYPFLYQSNSIENRERKYEREKKSSTEHASHLERLGKQAFVEENVIHPFMGKYNRPVNKLSLGGYAKYLKEW